ncbi:MAG: ribonuclease R [Cytophagales bacterium]
MSRKANQNRDRKPANSHANGQVIKELQNFLDKNFDEVFTKGELVKILKLREKKHISALFSAIDKLVLDKKAVLIEDSGYQSAFKPEVLEGVVDFVNMRIAYVMVPGLEEDVIVPAENLNEAFDGDTVKIMLVAPRKVRDDGRVTGEVIEIIERKREEYVGRIQVQRAVAFVVPDSKKMHSDFMVELDDTMEAKDGDKVLVKLDGWSRNGKNPKGIVTKVLGKSGDNNTEMNSIMAEFGLPVEFPKEVDDEANAIAWNLGTDELKKRRDFRNILTFTIDPIDAKDFDDALSIQKLENGNWEIGVHIADVTHYIQLNSKLESEAQKRATSVYLVDRCIPMLPEKLSNDLCSLKPNVDRLTFSAVFELDANAKIRKEWFGKTVIHSDRRFSYEEVQEIIEAGEGELHDEIKLMNDLAKLIKVERFKKGAINFETVEVKFKLDENGAPLGVFPKVRKDAHKLIEEFMLLANKRVAQFVFDYKAGKEKNTMVYRTHDKPDVEKLRSFSIFAKKFGYKLDAESNNVSKELNSLMEEVESKPEGNMLQNLAVRAMAKAKYTTDAMGHFGLAFDHYSHFTSPIRRYPDMMAHRLIEKYLKDDIANIEKKAFEEKCKHSSDMEKVAAEAERASIKYKQAEFMLKVIGQEFDAIVSGITEWGIFAEIIETKCEGLIRFQEMTDDFYDLDLTNYRVVGRKHNRVITFGDKIRIVVKGADLAKRQIDLGLAE